jgi:hypothetical protein
MQDQSGNMQHKWLQNPEILNQDLLRVAGDGLRVTGYGLRVCQPVTRNPQPVTRNP